MPRSRGPLLTRRYWINRHRNRCYARPPEMAECACVAHEAVRPWATGKRRSSIRLSRRRAKLSATALAGRPHTAAGTPSRSVSKVEFSGLCDQEDGALAAPVTGLAVEAAAIGELYRHRGRPSSRTRATRLKGAAGAWGARNARGCFSQPPPYSDARLPLPKRVATCSPRICLACTSRWPDWTATSPRVHRTNQSLPPCPRTRTLEAVLKDWGQDHLMPRGAQGTGPPGCGLDAQLERSGRNAQLP